MSAYDDRRVSEWIHGHAAHRVPDHLDAVLRETSQRRQRPAWSSLERWLPMQATMRLAPMPRVAWLLILIVALVAVGVALVVGSQRQRLPAPYGPAVNGALLYVARGDVYRADPDGSHPRVLVGGPEDDVAVVSAPDGTRFAFARAVLPDQYELLAANAAGRDVRFLTQAPVGTLSALDWSPDGTYLLVLHTKDGMDTLSILAADGSRSMRDLPLGDVRPEQPSWRPPDGQEIVFRGIEDRVASVYVIAADGSALRRLAPAVRDDGAYLNPRVSPDGTRVTFWDNTKIPDLEINPHVRKSDVHVLDLATGRDVRVGYDPGSRDEQFPKFSPDGRSVLLVRFNAIPGPATLHLAAADGTGPAPQIGPPQQYWDGNPMFEFSPDGRKVLLTFGEDQPLQVVDVASGLVAYGEGADFPSWQRMAP
jgi:dipeptidyl aminopeptidase/acylaminoacyl peptidase